jgi:hypothetical protein
VAPGSHVFQIFATTAAGALDSVEGQLTVAPEVALNPLAVHVALLQATGTAGQGTPATFTLRITNEGDTADTYQLSAGALPAGVTATFSQESVVVPPGQSNFRDVTVTLTPSPGASAGNYAFQVTASSDRNASVSASAAGSLAVLASGVRVTLNPTSNAPGSTFLMTVTNTGQLADTFDLALAGPAAFVAQLGPSSVSLAPGASQVFPITTGAVSFADPGALALTALATSQTSPAVRAAAIAQLSIPATQGMTAAFDPASVSVQQVGPTSFLLLVHNTGNTEDAYTATITGISGAITAQLDGLDGQPTKTIPIFRLPGLFTGAILLQTDVLGPGPAAVTVQVQSLDNPSLTASATATVSAVFVPTVTVMGGTFTYDGQTHPASGSVSGFSGANLGTPTFTYTDASNVTTSSPPVNAGTYTVTASFAGSAAYSAASKTATIVITPATPTVTATDAGGVYNGGAFPASATTIGVGSDGTLAMSPDSSLTFSYYSGPAATGPSSAAPPVHAGTYTVVAHYAGRPNYTAADSAALTFQIGQATPTVMVTPVSTTFDGQPHGTTGQVTGVGGANLGPASIAYSSGSVPTQPGTYVATGTFAGNTDYQPATGTATITITAALATQLAFTTAPAAAFAGFNLNSPGGVQVVVENAAGAVQTGDHSTVTITLLSGPAGGAFLPGSVTSVAAQNGIATFTRLAFTLSGSYTLRATDGTLTAATATVIISPNAGILLLDPSGSSLTLSGNASLNLTNTGAVAIVSSSAGAVSLSGNATLSASEVDVQGGLSTSGHATVQAVVHQGVAPPADPLARLPVPTRPSTQFTAGHYSGTLQPGTYVGGISVAGNSAITLPPGVYYLTGGGLIVSGTASVTGIGVMIYVTGLTSTSAASLDLSGNATVTLTPPTGGTYQGIGFFQDRTSHAAMNLSGNAVLNATGTMYAPGAAVNLSGNNPAQSSLGAQWIVGHLTLSGNARFTIAADANNRSQDPNAFKVAGGPVQPTGLVPSLTQHDVAAAVRETLRLWGAAGVDTHTLEALAQAAVTITPLPAPYLGLAAPGAIYLDPTAQGHGWFTDTSRAAIVPADRMDLLTVVAHELAHLFGLMDGNGTALMAPSLAAGERIPVNADDLLAPHSTLLAVSHDLVALAWPGTTALTAKAAAASPTARADHSAAFLVVSPMDIAVLPEGDGQEGMIAGAGAWLGHSLFHHKERLHTAIRWHHSYIRTGHFGRNAPGGGSAPLASQVKLLLHRTQE